jgi:hypothetical protein
VDLRFAFGRYVLQALQAENVGECFPRNDLGCGELTGCLIAKRGTVNHKADASEPLFVAERGGEDRRSALSPRTSVCDVSGDLKTPFKTRSPKASETREASSGQALAKSAVVKVTPTFRTSLDGLPI